MKKIFCLLNALCVVIISSNVNAATDTAPANPSKPEKTCVNLNGRYWLPLQKHDRSDDPGFMVIRQDKCRLINVTIAHGGFFPISRDSSLDGTEGFFIVGQTIVRKETDGSSFSFTTEHGSCSARAVVFSLDNDQNLVITSKRVFDCEDKYKGPFTETFPRIIRKPAPVKENL